MPVPYPTSGDAPGPPADLLAWQAEWCRRIGSPLYERLLLAASEDARAGGPTAELLAPHAGDPFGSALPLRLMGAVHRLVLQGLAPELAAHYPSVGGTPGADVWEVFRDVLVERFDEVRLGIEHPVQTNEVGRAQALVGGFLSVADRYRLPLRLLEMGSSAGLLLRWDAYLYEARGATWGPKDSPVRLCDFNSEKPLPFAIEAEVRARAGCDPNPVDPTTDEGRLTLMSYVWPDQVTRFRLLRAALEVAVRVPAPVQRADGPTWIEQRLTEALPGVATVVFHSIVLQYLEEDARQKLYTALDEAGGRATESAPLAWLRMEPGGDDAHVRLKLWPGGGDHLIATAGYHGQATRWLGLA